MQAQEAIVPGFEPLKMELANDCGPVAMLQALRCSFGEDAPDRDELLGLWGFVEGADRLDTPGAHLCVLRRLGVGFCARRGLKDADLRRAVEAGLPVVMLAPVGLCRWHWIVLAGCSGEDAIVSAGDGCLSRVPMRRLGARCRSDRIGRALGVEAFGYCLPSKGVGPPFAHDARTERDMVRLAALAEGGLAAVEPAFKALAAIGKWGWRRKSGRDILKEPCRGE